jgi:5-formyltetrahydrofolate cyclo-ligase
MTKKELRAKYKILRKKLSPDEISEKSLTIANKLLSLPVWDKDFYHVFLPISEMNEVDTQFILHILSGKDKHIVVSRSDFDTRQMTHFLLADNTTIRKNEYGIPEPLDGIAIDTKKIDVVFVPLLAFDNSGNRVGYGKGFYDKFLAECRTDTIKIGLSFFDAVEPLEDVFESDVKLDYCVMPDNIYSF